MGARESSRATTLLDDEEAFLNLAVGRIVPSIFSIFWLDACTAALARAFRSGIYDR